MTLTTDVYFSQMDVTVECEVEFTPVKATRDSWGYAGGEQGEPAHVENMRVWHYYSGMKAREMTGHMTGTETAELESQCLEYANDRALAAQEAREDR